MKTVAQTAKKAIAPQGKLIRAMMMMQGITCAGLARKLNVSRVAVSRTVSGRMVSQKIQEAVAAALGTERKSLWP